jgi:hypothetical protein
MSRFILFALIVVPALAWAQASQPASQPGTPAATVATAAWIIWLKANWYWLLVGVLIPSILTGLSKFPGPTTNKVIAILQMIVDILGITTHKNSPNTFKLPFTRSKPPGWVKPEKPAKPPLAPVAMLLLVPVLAVTLGSCCVFRGDCKSKPGQIATLVVDCTIEAVKTLATEMLPAVIAIITSGGKNWSEMLDLLKGAGFDALACSLQQAGQEVQNMTVRPGAVETHYLVKMKTTPVEVQARINKYLGEAKGKDGKLYRVEFKKPAVVTP